MKILFVLNQLPYPPRNGVTIPTYNYLSGLAQTHDVSLLFLRDPSPENFNKESIEENRALVDNLWILGAEKFPIGRRIMGELRGEKFFHTDRIYDREVIQRIFSHHQFDAIWISTEEILNVIDVLRLYSTPNTTYIAGLNDCITDVFLYARKRILIRAGSLKEKLFKFIKWLRGMRAGPIETRLLQDYNIILVQSDKDRQSLSRVSTGKLDSKIIVLSNGVAPELLETDIPINSNNILFVGSLRGYSRIVELLLKDVWPEIKSRHPGTVFYIIGKGASDTLRHKMASLKDVVHIEFVADIRDVYKDKTLSFSPVFKNYGLINKVVESMAAGVPVVADQGSFNGIPEFEAGTHGMVGNNASAMVEAADKLLSSRELRIHIGREARNLIRKHFKWDDRIQSIQRCLEDSRRL